MSISYEERHIVSIKNGRHNDANLKSPFPEYYRPSHFRHQSVIENHSL